MAAWLGHELVVLGAAFDSAGFGPVGPDGQPISGQGQEQVAMATFEFGSTTTAAANRPDHYRNEVRAPANGKPGERFRVDAGIFHHQGAH